MFCTGKEQLTCNSEKMGCEGCYFEKERWKDIPNYEGLYQISNLGRIKSLKRNQEIILKPNIIRSKYFQVCLYKQGTQTLF